MIFKQKSDMEPKKYTNIDNGRDQISSINVYTKKNYYESPKANFYSPRETSLLEKNTISYPRAGSFVDLVPNESILKNNSTISYNDISTNESIRSVASFNNNRSSISIPDEQISIKKFVNLTPNFKFTNYSYHQQTTQPNEFNMIKSKYINEKPNLSNSGLFILQSKN
jgi:hypothetical protein